MEEDSAPQAEKANSNSKLDETREKVYRMISSQLFYDGYQSAAVTLGGLLKTVPPSAPSDRLSNIVTVGRRVEEAQKGPKTDDTLILGLDLDFGTDSRTQVLEPHTCQLTHLSIFKEPCTISKFSRCGTYAAVASQDGNIKVMSVHRMAHQDQEDGRVTTQPDQEIPLIRNLNDHTDAVNGLDFHPNQDIVISGSSDETIKFYNIAKPAVKRAARTVRELAPVTSLSFHPSGEYFVAGAEDKAVRLYNTETVQCYSTKIDVEEHAGNVTCVSYSLAGRMFASCSEDGEIKLWDGVTNRLAQTFSRAHGGAKCCSVVFSRNSKYLLSTGLDGHGKLWELAMGRCLHNYVIPTQKVESRCCAAFNHTEDFVLLPEEKKSGVLGIFSAKTAEQMKKTLPLGHSGKVTHLSHSPTMPAFLTCSEEGRAKFWFKSPPVEDIL